MAYETFERQSVSIEDPAVTVAPLSDGRIALNASAARLLKKAGITAVRILWDKATFGLAVQAAEKGSENSYSVVFGRGGRQAAFSAKAFLRYIGWSCARRQTFRATWDEQEKMLEVKLPARFVGGAPRAVAADTEPVQKLAKGSRFRSPGASGNIGNWMALNETVPKK